jgi:hypothetical protein
MRSTSIAIGLVPEDSTIVARHEAVWNHEEMAPSQRDDGTDSVDTGTDNDFDRPSGTDPRHFVPGSGVWTFTEGHVARKSLPRRG